MFIVILLVSPATSFGWDDTGHMVVGHIAYSRLSPAAKRRVDMLLRISADRPNDRGLIYFCDRTYDPVTIGTWMDDIRGDSLNELIAPWHYININPLFDGIAAQPVKPATENVLTRIEWAIAELKKGTNLDNRAANKRNAELLGYLFHLVADVHQPLHCATRYSTKNADGDSGGNRFEIVIKDNPATLRDESKITNLHAYWDGAAGLFNFHRVERPLDVARSEEIQKYAARVTNAFPADANPAWKELRPEKWVEESNIRARNFAYVKTRDGAEPGVAYTKEAQQMSSLRMAFAGYRLAEVLNRTYGKS